MYEKQTWENLPAQTTPISAERLEHLETQYDTVMADLPALMSDSETPIGSALTNTIEGLVDPIAEGAVDDAVTAQDIPGQVGSEVAAQVPPAVAGAVSAQVPGAVAGAVSAQVPSAVAGEVASQVPLAVAGAVPSAVDAELDNQTPGAVAAELAVQVPVAVDNALTLADIPGEASAQVAIALAAQAGKIIQGVGMPNGVVTANPGTIYVDTVSTLGASVWRKVAGAGNTGWAVVEGDTGWRALSKWDASGVASGYVMNPSWGPVPGSAGGIYVRRTANTVWIEITNLERFNTAGVAVWDSAYRVPGEFRYHRNIYLVGLRTPVEFAVLILQTNGQLARGSSVMSGSDGPINLLESFPALPGWPTTLPGTPA